MPFPEGSTSSIQQRCTQYLVLTPCGNQEQRRSTSEPTYLVKIPGVREKLFIATKVLGYKDSTEIVLNRITRQAYEQGKFPARLDKQSILEACDASFRRLQTSYIDLYQLHWPDRYVPIFCNRQYLPEYERESVTMKETLEAVKLLLDQGKIWAYVLSNEIAFGVCQFLRLADELNMPRPVSIQNAFCLLDRSLESEFPEACALSNFNIGLLSWSILAGGVLTGKYNGKIDMLDNPVDEDSLKNVRFGSFRIFHALFRSQLCLEAAPEYKEPAVENDMSLATLA